MKQISFCSLIFICLVLQILTKPTRTPLKIEPQSSQTVGEALNKRRNLSTKYEDNPSKRSRLLSSLLKTFKKHTTKKPASHKCKAELPLVKEPGRVIPSRRSSILRHKDALPSYDQSYDYEPSLVDEYTDQTWETYFKPPYLSDQRKLDRLVDNFVLGELLGQGAYGNVFAAFDLKLKKNVAVKSIDKSLLYQVEDQPEKSINTEIHILSLLPNHPNICQFYRAIETSDKVRTEHNN